MPTHSSEKKHVQKGIDANVRSLAERRLVAYHTHIHVFVRYPGHFSSFDVYFEVSLVLCGVCTAIVNTTIKLGGDDVKMSGPLPNHHA